MKLLPTRSVKNKVKAAVAAHFNLDNSKLFLSHPTFFSELTAVPAVTPHDEYWHDHIDKETYPSFHYTSLLYLSEYKRDFAGGRFVFLSSFSAAFVKICMFNHLLKSGSCSLMRGQS